jgi:hypothetical protein
MIPVLNGSTIFYRSIHATRNARLGVRIAVANDRASKALMPSVARSGLSGASTITPSPRHSIFPSLHYSTTPSPGFRSQQTR